MFILIWEKCLTSCSSVVDILWVWIWIWVWIYLWILTICPQPDFLFVSSCFGWDHSLIFSIWSFLIYSRSFLTATLLQRSSSRVLFIFIFISSFTYFFVVSNRQIPCRLVFENPTMSQLLATTFVELGRYSSCGIETEDQTWWASWLSANSEKIWEPLNAGCFTGPLSHILRDWDTFTGNENHVLLTPWGRMGRLSVQEHIRSCNIKVIFTSNYKQIYLLIAKEI